LSQDCYLLVSIIMTLATPNLMLTLINTTYYGITQFLPGSGHSVRLEAEADRHRDRHDRQPASAVGLYLVPPAIDGFNVGLLCLAVTAVAVEVFDRVSPQLEVAHP
jgi:SSS family solute:Na+ symporter